MVGVRTWEFDVAYLRRAAGMTNEVLTRLLLCPGKGMT
jgi:hypothetical protein